MNILTHICEGDIAVRPGFSLIELCVKDQISERKIYASGLLLRGDTPVLFTTPKKLLN